MRRLHLLELHEQSWCPAAIRHGATDYLQFVIRVGRVYAPAADLLAPVLREAGTRQIVDLCSGGGGPWPELRSLLAERGANVRVELTDKFPNARARARGRLRGADEAAVHVRLDPVDAAAVPAELTGFRTLFTAFHHFAPQKAREVLADAVRNREGIAVFEATRRSWVPMLGMLLNILLVLIATPWIRPFRLSRLLWTYLLPAIPLAVAFDGVVSCLRTYEPDELSALAAPLASEHYHWTVGELRTGSGRPCLYLLGVPW